MSLFQLVSPFGPQGDQPSAIGKLVDSINVGNRYQSLMGVTGSGKTFTMANVIQQVQKPTLIISHNKTLAAQLYSEFKDFFPHNAVEYFVSYYDYYQPEAYVPQTDTYIEKDSNINDEIERLRIAATSALVSRNDVIVVASVSCIYGLGDPNNFREMMIPIIPGEALKRDAFLERLVQNLYERNDIELTRGKFCVRGEVVDVFPAYRQSGIRIEFWGDEVESVRELDPLTGRTGEPLEHFYLYPANQYITPRDAIERASLAINAEMEQQVADFEREKRLIEAQRIRMRVQYDMELLLETGVCSGIENYSRHLDGRTPGSRPWCLIDFFPQGEFLVILDESHVTIPQIGAMYKGDRARKERLVNYGFRLPSALDNRPLTAEEFWTLPPQCLFVSATPGKVELEKSAVVAELLIRPTGLLDPVLDLRPSTGQVEDLIGEAKKAVEAGQRVLVTTLTKRMSEDLTTFLRESGVKVEYLHSDIDAIERVEILRKLRHGKFDVLVGVNLLREGLDLPEVALVAILDADKEGFLRSETSLIQTAGRAARHEKGRVLLYADKMTEALRRTIETTGYRREKQLEHNTAHGITPRSVKRTDQASLRYEDAEDVVDPINLITSGDDADVAAVLAELETEMLAAAEELQFERAAILRDQIEALKAGKASGASVETAEEKSSSRGHHRRKKAQRGKDVRWGK